MFTNDKVALITGGKRIGAVVGSPALTQNALAIMAFGGLAKSDVRKFENILRDEMAAGIDYLRETAIKEFGTLSKDAAKRLKARRQKKNHKKRLAAAARV